MRVALAAALVSLFGFSTPSQAQVKLPVFDESDNQVRNVSFQDAKESVDFRHGKLLRVTMNNGETMKGTVVRTDPKRKVIYLRTEAGSMPRALVVNDIKRVEKGIIVQASTRSDVTSPEIQEMVIYNGGTKTVSYRAPTLSHQELVVLEDLEAAQNELARQKRLARMQDAVVANEIAIQSEDRQMRDIINRLLEVRLANYGMEGPYFDRTGRTVSIAGLPLYGGNQWGTELVIAQTAPAQVLTFGPTVTPKVLTTPDPLAESRRALAAVENRAIYEDGHLIAVMVPETVGAPSSAKQ
jgi:hypothetical protein